MEDRHTLLYVLQLAATVGFLVPEEERLSFMEETVALARALDQRLVLVHALPGYITALVARGQRALAEAELPGYQALVAEFRQPLHRVRAALVRALFCALDGDFGQADRLGSEAQALAEGAGSRTGLFLALTQRLSVALMRGRPDLMAGEAAKLLPWLAAVPGLVPYHAWLLAGLGRREEAAAELRNLNPGLLAPPMNLMETLGAAETCVSLGDGALGQTLYPLLLAAADRMFWSMAPGTLLGPTACTLGDLALLIGRAPEALRHYDEALAFCENLGAPALVERCRRLRDAALASGAGRPALARAPGTSSPSPSGPSTGKPLELRRQGDLWTVVPPAGEAFHLKHTKGLGYLRYLIDQPGRQVHVLELAGIEHQAGDAGPVLDARAKEQYRRRLDDLREEIAEAERFGDAARVRRSEAEIEAIAEQLAGAVGFGGRDRRAASDVERTRINMQRRLKDAILRIAAADPALGRYLTAAIKTGTYCAYHPL
jgi:tetratricopeptide (TPR) repeat protein